MFVPVHNPIPDSNFLTQPGHIPFLARVGRTGVEPFFEGGRGAAGKKGCDDRPDSCCHSMACSWD